MITSDVLDLVSFQSYISLYTKKLIPSFYFAAFLGSQVARSFNPYDIISPALAVSHSCSVLNCICGLPAQKAEPILIVNTQTIVLMLLLQKCSHKIQPFLFIQHIKRFLIFCQVFNQRIKLFVHNLLVQIHDIFLTSSSLQT